MPSNSRVRPLRARPILNALSPARAPGPDPNLPARIQFSSTEVTVVRGGVLAQPVDCVVNAANRWLQDGGGITGAIYAAAGPGLAREVAARYPHGTPPGTAVLTGGHRLRQPFILHVPGPDYRLPGDDHAEVLAAAYRACIVVAGEAGLESLAICSLSTGIFGFPLEPAAWIAVAVTLATLRANPRSPLRRVVFAMHGAEEHTAFAAALREYTGS